MSAEASPAGFLFGPAQVAGLRLKSRVAMAPMSRYLCPDGVPQEAAARYYARRARHGVGLVITEATYIDHPSAPSYEGVPDFHGAALAGWRRVREAVHAEGGLIFPQLWHTGSFRQSSMGPVRGVPGFGPSENRNAFTLHPEPTRAMDERDIAEVVDAYARAAAGAKALGFDGIEIHGAHGYLIDEFLWEATNRRSDRYGGDRRGRTRFAVEVVRAMRGATGPDFPVSFRFSQFKQQDYAARLADTPAELAEMLEPLAEAGVSILHASARRFWEPAFPDHGPMTLAGWARRITGLPTIMVGGAGLDRPGLKEARPAPLDLLDGPASRGEFDLLAVGRALIAEPAWVEKVAGGNVLDCRAYDKSMLATLD